MQNLRYKNSEDEIKLFDQKIFAKDIIKKTKYKEFSYYFIKRAIDIIGSLSGIIILSPIFLIIPIFIKIDSRGPIFFIHKRLGQNGKDLNVYKFRTMVNNADEILKNMNPKLKKEFEINFKLDNDSRITKVGKFLRETSLDELPQLFNILIGNMSIVGPRPIVEKEKKKYGVYFNKLITVKPGLTGLWQANGRSNTTYEERVALDMEYIDKKSILLDLKIILNTVVVVFEKKGAY